MGRLLQLLSAASASTSWWPGCGEFGCGEFGCGDFALDRVASRTVPLKAVLVVAHPDDESECAGTLYRLCHELGGIVDQVVVTNGEGGQHFVAPALDYYGLSRSRKIARELPRLRRRELLRAGRILGVRRHYFLEQRDPGFTLDPAEGFECWDIPSVRRELQSLFEREQYDLVITLLPSEDTHGHHKTVAALALEAAAELPAAERPAVAGVRTGAPALGSPLEFNALAGYPCTSTTSAAPVWSFDRRTPLANHVALDHSIIVNWVIAEHKSQGLFQMEYGRHTHEYFWQFTTGRNRWDSIWPRLRELAGAPHREHNANALVMANWLEAHPGSLLTPSARAKRADDGL